jgi:multidrug efflux pump subunit AcrA (membrane-fusion protein)
MEINMRIWLAVLICLGSSQAIALELNGRTEFSRQLTLNSSISARVEGVMVAVGDRVSAGQLVLKLVSTGLQIKVDIARAEANSLAPTVARMQTELDKAQELFDRDSLALVALQVAEQNHTIAAAKLEVANAKLALALYQLSQTEIRSPIDGVILAVDSFPGQFINTRVTDQPLLRIADSSSMIVKVSLPLELWNSSLLQRAAAISFGQQTFKGEVIEVGNQVVVGDNNHPAVVLLARFKTGGKLPAGLPIVINIEDN